MLKRKLCQATFTWRLTCDGPLLIADGRYDQKKLPKDKGKYPDKVFISHAHPDAIHKAVETKAAETLGLPFYIPGTSLRGPFRAQAERIIRSLLSEAPLPLTACNPFDTDGQDSQSCSKRLETIKPDEVPYAKACPACKLFGCTGTASRIQFPDADIAPGYASVYRDMIGIDRFTGGVFQGEKDQQGEKKQQEQNSTYKGFNNLQEPAHFCGFFRACRWNFAVTEKKSGGANMRFHALENISFTITVTVTNFELWQLGLLAYVFRDFQDGLVPIGFGKTKGFGQVKGDVQSITLTYPQGKAGGKIQHLGSLVSGDERKHYGLHDAEPPPCAGLTPVKSQGLSLYETFAAIQQDALWAAVAPAFNNFINSRNQEIQP